MIDAKHIHGQVYFDRAGNCLGHSGKSGAYCADCLPEQCPACCEIAAALYANAGKPFPVRAFVRSVLDRPEPITHIPADTPSADCPPRRTGMPRTLTDEQVRELEEEAERVRASLRPLSDDVTLTRSMRYPVPRPMTADDLRDYLHDAPPVPRPRLHPVYMVMVWGGVVLSGLIVLCLCALVVAHAVRSGGAL